MVDRYHSGTVLPMPLNLKNPEVERLATEVASLAGETKTEAIRRALEERRQRLVQRRGTQNRSARTIRFLEDEVWSQVPDAQLGRHLDPAEEDAILGYGPEGA